MTPTPTPSPTPEEMDPESNWDICPVCMDYLYGLDEFPGRQTMRSHHNRHKLAKEAGRA